MKLKEWLGRVVDAPGDIARTARRWASAGGFVEPESYPVEVVVQRAGRRIDEDPVALAEALVRVLGGQRTVDAHLRLGVAPDPPQDVRSAGFDYTGIGRE